MKNLLSVLFLLMFVVNVSAIGLEIPPNNGTNNTIAVDDHDSEKSYLYTMATYEENLEILKSKMLFIESTNHYEYSDGRIRDVQIRNYLGETILSRQHIPFELISSWLDENIHIVKAYKPKNYMVVSGGRSIGKQNFVDQLGKPPE